MNMLQRAWELPPTEIMRKVRRRLFPKPGPDIESLLRSPKLMRSQRLYDFLSRYEKIVSRSTNFKPLDFVDQDVVEIGCGPLFGFGPLAIFLGCKSFTGVDPVADSSVFKHSKIQEQYLLKVYKDLAGVYGPLFEFSEYLERVLTRTVAASDPVLDARLSPASMDIALSNSALEHLHPAPESVAILCSWLRPGARFLHLVDLGNHLPTRNPFEGMYAVEPGEYFQRFGQGINLLRSPELLSLFIEHGAEATSIPYYFFREFFTGPIHPYWRKKFTEDVLFEKTVILFGSIR